MDIVNYKTGAITLHTNNTERMRIDSAGNVGIGTASPQRLFHISQALTSASTLLAIDNPNTTDNNGAVVSFRTTTTGGGATEFTELSAIQHTVSAHDHATRASDLAFFISDTGTLKEAVRIQSSGNVGVGTTNPATLLHVEGATPDPTFRIKDSGEAGDHHLDILQGFNSYVTATHALYFGVNNSSANAVSILANGNVGVGTTGPTKLLTVKGQGNTAWLTVHRTGSTAEQFSIINAETSAYTASTGTASPTWTNVIDANNSNIMLSTANISGSG